MCAPQEPPGPRRQVLFIVLVASIASLAIAVAAWKIFSIVSNSERIPSATPPISSATRPAGRLAPDFTLPLFSGGTLSLHSLKGKPVLLNFWASWCVPCREETPLLVRLHKTYGPRGIVFVGVNVEDDARAAREFLGQYRVDYPVVRSVDDGLIDAYAIPGIPTTVFIGANGVVVDKFTGGFMGPSGEKALVTRLERVLGAPQP
jgi:cytochrome c biogenesis protein CcmG/thiol:disulfide interchange protein DsbE